MTTLFTLQPTAPVAPLLTPEEYVRYVTAAIRADWTAAEIGLDREPTLLDMWPRGALSDHLANAAFVDAPLAEGRRQVLVWTWNMLNPRYAIKHAANAAAQGLDKHPLMEPTQVAHDARVRRCVEAVLATIDASYIDQFVCLQEVSRAALVPLSDSARDRGYGVISQPHGTDNFNLLLYNSARWQRMPTAIEIVSADSDSNEDAVLAHVFAPLRNGQVGPASIAVASLHLGFNMGPTLGGTLVGIAHMRHPYPVVIAGDFNVSAFDYSAHLTAGSHVLNISPPDYVRYAAGSARYTHINLAGNVVDGDPRLQLDVFDHIAVVKNAPADA